jgi:hypothetical protein
MMGCLLKCDLVRTVQLSKVCTESMCSFYRHSNRLRSTCQACGLRHGEAGAPTKASEAMRSSHSNFRTMTYLLPNLASFDRTVRQSKVHDSTLRLSPRVTDGKFASIEELGRVAFLNGCES